MMSLNYCNRFKLLQSLSICPEVFNEFESSSYPKQNKWHHLNSLILDHFGSDNVEHIQTLMNSKRINFEQITKVKTAGFWKRYLLFISL